MKEYISDERIDCALRLPEGTSREGIRLMAKELKERRSFEAREKTFKAIRVLTQEKSLEWIIAFCVALLIHKRDEVPLEDMEFDKLIGAPLVDFDGGGQALYYAIEGAVHATRS